MQNMKREFYSYITGFEYVITRVFDKVWDLNLFTEYSNDDRGSNSEYISKWFIFRNWISFNDVEGTEITQALTLDLNGDGNTGSLEISTRIMESVRLAVNYTSHWSVNNKDTLLVFKRQLFRNKNYKLFLISYCRT